MRAWVTALVIANVALALYGVFTARHPPGSTAAPVAEINADRVRPVPLAADPVQPCLEWGPLAPPELARALEALKESAIGTPRVREVSGIPVWWVHVPPLRSREDAERRLREIEELGVKEARIVADESYRHAISLGIFRSEEAATAYQARMRENKVRNSAIVQRPDLLKFSTILIVRPAPKAVARTTELAASIAGSEVKAVACPANE